MFKQLCKHYLSVQPIFTPKTHNHASADGNLQVPEYPSAQVPEYPNAWVPKFSSLECSTVQVPKCPSAQVFWVPECPSTFWVSECPKRSSAQMPKCLECLSGQVLFKCPSAEVPLQCPWRTLKVSLERPWSAIWEPNFHLSAPWLKKNPQQSAKFLKTFQNTFCT